MLSKGSILIVDDEAGPRESLRMILKPMYDVHTVENGGGGREEGVGTKTT